MSSLRWITWSIPGTGLTTLVTDLFAERISECELVRLHKSWLIIFPAKTSRLVDRGFAFCTIYYPNLNIVFVPAFMRGRSQMFPVEIINARRMSQDRYTIHVWSCVFSCHPSQTNAGHSQVRTPPIRNWCRSFFITINETNDETKDLGWLRVYCIGWLKIPQTIECETVFESW